MCLIIHGINSIFIDNYFYRRYNNKKSPMVVFCNICHIVEKMVENQYVDSYEDGLAKAGSGAWTFRGSRKEGIRG